jgi:hypothetical protein
VRTPLLHWRGADLGVVEAFDGGEGEHRERKSMRLLDGKEKSVERVEVFSFQCSGKRGGVRDWEGRSLAAGAWAWAWGFWEGSGFGGLEEPADGRDDLDAGGTVVLAGSGSRRMRNALAAGWIWRAWTSGRISRAKELANVLAELGLGVPGAGPTSPEAPARTFGRELFVVGH